MSLLIAVAMLVSLVPPVTVAASDLEGHGSSSNPYPVLNGQKEISKMEKYVVPNMEIIEFETEDVITTSGPVPGEDEMEIMRP